jgi:choloylglycine hydrolase
MFGSVTFNQYGREFPQGGMNEAGLVVESMALKSTRFPAPDSRSYFPNALLYRQYLLDTCSSVKDVIESDSKVRISYDASKGIGIHLQILDRDGNAAIIEFLDGKTVVYTGESMPVRVLANDTYQESLEYWKRGMSPIWDSGNSIERFTTAANLVQNNAMALSKPSLEQTFDYLGRVASNSTRWSIVYDNRGMKIHLRTESNARVRTIDVAKFDFSCKTPVMALNINDNLAGDVTRNFQNYDPETNTQLVKTSNRKLGSRFRLPDQVLEFLGKYPQQCKCQE